MHVENLQFPQNPSDFFLWLKETSEAFWSDIEINKGVFGFQTQKETKWLKGLSEAEIQAYEATLGWAFPEVYKNYLRNMNGTDKPAINVYGNSEKVAYAAGYYSFPRDLAIVGDKIKWIYEEFSVDEETVRRENIPHIIPIVSHRFLIADNCAENPVLSMQGRDSILYAPSLESFLAADIFQNHSNVPTDSDFQIKLWLDEDLEHLSV
jgi:hypothetical protein